MQKIFLTNGGFTMVDDEDFEFLNQFEWKTKVSDGSDKNLHAVREIRVGNKRMTIRMHRLVTEARFDDRVIHINGRTLDNRRSNLQKRRLRPWTGRPNNAGFRGVEQVATNRWKVTLDFAGRSHVLSDTMDDPVRAAHLYDDAVLKLYGKNAITNFPQD